MISDKVYISCVRARRGTSSLLAQDPSLYPGEAWKKLYGSHASGKKERKVLESRRDNITPEDLKRAAECGKWGPQSPSELFLRVSVSLLRSF